MVADWGVSTIPARRRCRRDAPRARRSLGREEGACSRQNLKPFVVNPVGPNPTRQGLATHRKRVLRGASESSTPRSVDSECAGRGNQPRETVMGSRRRGVSGRQHLWRRMAWRQGSPGVSAQGMYKTGSAQEPGRTLRSPRSIPGWAPGDQSSRPTAEGVRTLWDRRSGRIRGTAKRRKRSAAGWAQGSRSTPIVPRKRGNHPEGPRGGKRGVGPRNSWRER